MSNITRSFFICQILLLFCSYRCTDGHSASSTSTTFAWLAQPKGAVELLVMSVDHASGVASTRPILFLHKTGITLIIDDCSDWRMADVIWVDGGQTPFSTLFQVTDVGTSVNYWVNADLVT